MRFACSMSQMPKITRLIYFHDPLLYVVINNKAMTGCEMRAMRIVINDYQDSSSISFTWDDWKEASLILHDINFLRRLHVMIIICYFAIHRWKLLQTVEIKIYLRYFFIPIILSLLTSYKTSCNRKRRFIAQFITKNQSKQLVINIKMLLRDSIQSQIELKQTSRERRIASLSRNLILLHSLSPV